MRRFTPFDDRGNIKHFKYIGPPNKQFEGEVWYTIEGVDTETLELKFSELTYSISYKFFISSFEEITEQDKFHKKLLNIVNST